MCMEGQEILTGRHGQMRTLESSHLIFRWDLLEQANMSTLPEQQRVKQVPAISKVHMALLAVASIS